jgi:predicted DNA binding CopG/RHH family protein
MPKRAPKAIPHFDSEDEEREFWATHDSAGYVDWKKARRGKMSDLKPTTRTVSIRLPETMLEDLRMLANKRDVPYQSLLKIYVAERIEEELQSSRAAENAA